MWTAYMLATLQPLRKPLLSVLSVLSVDGFQHILAALAPASALTACGQVGSQCHRAGRKKAFKSSTPGCAHAYHQ